MLLAAALAFASILPPFHYSQVTQHRYVTGIWTLTVGHDHFTGAVTCSLGAPAMRYRSGILIFHLKNGLETTHATYRLNDGAAALVSDAFHELETHGFFPRRGWVDNPVGGDVALPASYLHDADHIWIRATTTTWPVMFKVNQLNDALASAHAQGCGETSFDAAS